MKLPFVSRTEHEAVLADRERIRSERDQFAKDRDTQRAVARKATDQYAALNERYTDTAIVNECLTHDLTVAREQLAAHEKGSRKDWRSLYEAERKRADGLQRRLDDAVGLKPQAIQDSSRWQPGYKAPKEDPA
ncbi:hypothetical protein [Streptomyces sp. NRRL S-1022]|uniref:hypothetical protein n=1 Tax=Streptomyces sp. NRRL S-1022 TaxID=1463880 RepID=UPI0004C1CAB8|nr:hypothetical protein [Streptomyces sp. NRRL S-1022]